MMKLRSICTALAAASLAVALVGCAGVKTDVHASVPTAPLQGKTYAVTRLPSQDSNPAYAQYETLVQSELAKYGFSAANDGHTRYLLSLAYETRPATVGFAAGDCAAAASAPTADCRNASETSASFFGRRAYRHTLTLRFLERASGDEAYKVSATSRDHDADPLHAIPYLVKSALAQFPYSGHTDWQVKLQAKDEASAPDVVSVKPIEP